MPSRVSSTRAGDRDTNFDDTPMPFGCVGARAKTKFMGTIAFVGGQFVADGAKSTIEVLNVLTPYYDAERFGIGSWRRFLAFAHQVRHRDLDAGTVVIGDGRLGRNAGRKRNQDE